MGGADKGWLLLNGEPLVMHALRRLQPQVGSLLVSANRHLERYRSLGVPVVTDDPPGFEGPLAGVLAGLEACNTPWMACVPCDAPCFPADLVGRLHQAALAQGRDAAVVVSVRQDRRSIEPAFCLLRAALAPSLRASMAAGERRWQGWLNAVGAAPVEFAIATDAADPVKTDPFANLNTPEDLAQAQRPGA